jgi:GntR family transcriptional regulator, transcriptional repressor for pyruvate dehydrogenase complex
LATESESGKADGLTAASTVANELAALILDQLPPGSSLPSEAELATRYAVSRLTVREAVKMLAGRGMLVLSRGRRAVVREPDGSAFSDFLLSHMHNDPKGLFDLVEVRLSLEVQSATLAAKRVTRAGLAALETSLQGMRDVARELAQDGDPREMEVKFHRFDIGFHGALALASGNRVLTYLFEAMAGPLEQGFYISRRGHQMRGHPLEDTIAAHQRILDCVRAGNGRAAAEAMRFHLKDTGRDIRAALSTLSSGPAPRS